LTEGTKYGILLVWKKKEGIKMKIDKNSIAINKDNPAWEVGDVIKDANNNLWLVAWVADLGRRPFYAVIDLESGCSSDSYETIAELRHHTGDPGDRLLTGTFKYEASK